jgi:esterase
LTHPLYVKHTPSRFDQKGDWVYLHGFLGNHRNFRRIAQLLGENYGHYLLDLPFHGQSMIELDPSFKGICASIQTWLIDTRLTDPVMLIGHSFGGRILMGLDYKQCPMVSAIVIEDISPDPIPMTYKGKLINFLLQADQKSWSSQKEAEKFILSFGLGPDISLLLLNYYKKSEGSSDFSFSLDPNPLCQLLKTTDRLDLWGDYKKIPIPTCIVRGETSQYLTEESFQKMLQQNSNAQGHVCTGTGHWAHIQDPKQFCGIVQSFLKSL